MNTPFYTVLEVQDLGSSKAVLSQCYDNKNSAYSDYFTRCASAAISVIPYHAAYLIESGYGCIEQREWDRRNEE